MYVAVEKPSFISVASRRVPAIGMTKSNVLFTNHCTSTERFCMVCCRYRIHVYYYSIVNPAHM
jgi:hypothetical protein